MCYQRSRLRYSGPNWGVLRLFTILPDPFLELFDISASFLNCNVRTNTIIVKRHENKRAKSESVAQN